MIDRREKNAAIFEDTEQKYRTEPELVQAIENCINNQYFTGENEEIQIPAPIKQDMARIVVSGKRTLEAAESFYTVKMKTGGAEQEVRSLCLLENRVDRIVKCFMILNRMEMLLTTLLLTVSDFWK